MSKNDLNDLNCKIAEDLMPLYSEKLCSPESQDFMKQHLATCENCRKLFAQMPIPKIVPNAVPDEKKSFFRIQKKFRRNLFQIISLSILSSALLLGIGYLSYGQITKKPRFLSFETICQDMEIKTIVKAIAGGDFEKYLQTVSVNLDFALYDNTFQKKFLEKAKKDLEKTYQDAFGNTSVESIKTLTCYVGNTVTPEVIPVSVVSVTYQDGQRINFCLMRNLDGKFIIDPKYFAGENSKEEIAFLNCLRYVCCQEDISEEVTATTLKTNGVQESEEKQKIVSHDATLRFAPEYRENLEKNFLEFYQQGYYISECYFSELRYDEDKKLLYHLVTVTAQDAQGSAILLTRIYSDYNGLIPPSQDMGKIYADNCSEKLTEDLLKLFG
ncbi:MAG: zf-HC2 domain-containing protein [Oscillospiraceae bacterium]|nr:zf-HC2 domain-containing protein [Oscillospiraceae bacterium]